MQHSFLYVFIYLTISLHSTPQDTSFYFYIIASKFLVTMDAPGSSFWSGGTDHPWWLSLFFFHLSYVWADASPWQQEASESRGPDSVMAHLLTGPLRTWRGCPFNLDSTYPARSFEGLQEMINVKCSMTGTHEMLAINIPPSSVGKGHILPLLIALCRLLKATRTYTIRRLLTL